MVLTYAFCNVSVMPVRAEPSHRSEQVNEMLFGERAEVLEINDKDWARIRCEWEGYEGWCRTGQVTYVSYKEYRRAPKFFVARNGDRLVFEHSEQWLPIGSELFGVKNGKTTVMNQVGKFKGKKLTIKKLEVTQENLKQAALQYLNAPYLWGGRSIAGIDCSGLSQMAFKLCGKPIPRDASQQALEGETVDFLQNAHCGDLAFFDNAEGKIVHVGLLLNDHTIIHATETSGRVVIDRIDPGGIISTSLKKRTHTLRVVKRYLKD
ncbi:C40 family peptidase [Polluticoccus soli]|uniref:C40 family peptidase n=1 Tax=Polluticoccus soli TaxID=3034150 RepID=UPI0023E2CDC5|nr:SH3 domain-containing C40 family peptidase [Flavipsychrobacter sp. JY13-12]